VSAPVVLALSHHGGVPAVFAPYAAAGRLLGVAEAALPEALGDARGLILTMHLDQVGLHASGALLRFLHGGGRCVFNGHVLRPLLPELLPFRPSGQGRRADLDLVDLADHRVLAGVPRVLVQTRRGVAGFYGRGHNPPLPGATALTGIGPARAPVDWVCAVGAGALFSHAGNDLWTVADDPAVSARLVANMLAWLAP
jgi:hypothetical protein